MNNTWHKYPDEKPVHSKWVIVVDSTCKSKTIALYTGYEWMCLDAEQDPEDMLVTHWMELPVIPSYEPYTPQMDADGWSRFPISLPPEGKDLFVIDANISPIVFNLATYSLYGGFKLLMSDPSNMHITHFYILPENPKPIQPTAGWNKFPQSVPHNSDTVLVKLSIETNRLDEPIYKNYLACANWRNGHFYVDFDDDELDNEYVVAWSPLNVCPF